MNLQLNEEIIKSELKELVRGSVEEILNNLLEQEARELTNAARYERTEARQPRSKATLMKPFPIWISPLNMGQESAQTT